LNGLAAGTYYVRAFPYKGIQNPSYTLTIKPPTGSSSGQNGQNGTTPEDFVAEQKSDGQVVLSWNAIENATTYYIYQQNGSEWVLITTTTDVTITLSPDDLATDDYTFAVTAIVNDEESEKTTTTTSDEEVVPSTNPEDPNNPTPDTDPNNPTPDTDPNNPTLDPDPNNPNPDTDPNNPTLDPDPNNPNPDTDPNNPTPNNPDPTTPTPPSVPSGVTATRTGNGQVTFNWNAVTGATSYNIYQVDGQNLVLVGTVTGTSFTLSNLASGSYTWKISAVSNNGESGKNTINLAIENNSNIEGNNTIETAHDLGAVTKLTTLENLDLHDGEDADWYRFELTAKGDVNSYIRLEFLSALGNLNLQLFDSSQKLIKTSALNGDMDQLTLNKLAAGVYYIKVYGQLGATNPSYTLTVIPPAASVIPDPVTPEEPTTPEPVTPEEPTTPEPVTPEEPTTPEPVTPEEPTTPEPVTPEEPTTPEPVTPDPVTPEPTTPIPTEPEPTTPDLTTTPVDVVPTTPTQPVTTPNVQTQTDSLQVTFNRSVVTNDLSKLFFETHSEFLVSAPVVEIIGHETTDEGGVIVQWTISESEQDEEPVNLYYAETLLPKVSETVVSKLQIFVAFSSFAGRTNKELTTEFVESNVYQVEQPAEPEQGQRQESGSESESEQE
jgi:outer membrane biosynthesis protein TonB